MQIPSATLDVIRRSTLTLADERYIYVKAGKVDRPEEHLVVSRDGRDVTVVTEERFLSGVEVLARNPDRWALLKIDCANPFYCPGFFLAMMQPCTAAGIDVLAVSAFTYDLLLVQEAKVLEAIELLVEAGFKRA